MIASLKLHVLIPVWLTLNYFQSRQRENNWWSFRMSTVFALLCEVFIMHRLCLCISGFHHPQVQPVHVAGPVGSESPD